MIEACLWDNDGAFDCTEDMSLPPVMSYWCRYSAKLFYYRISYLYRLTKLEGPAST